MTPGQAGGWLLHPELRHDHHVVPPRAEGAPQELLRLPATVEVGGVKERDSGLERGPDHLLGAGLVDPAPEVVATEPGDGHAPLAYAPSLVLMTAPACGGYG